MPRRRREESRPSHAPLLRLAGTCAWRRPAITCEPDARTSIAAMFHRAAVRITHVIAVEVFRARPESQSGDPSLSSSAASISVATEHDMRLAPGPVCASQSLHSHRHSNVSRSQLSAKMAGGPSAVRRPPYRGSLTIWPTFGKCQGCTYQVGDTRRARGELPRVLAVAAKRISEPHYPRRSTFGRHGDQRNAAVR